MVNWMEYYTSEQLSKLQEEDSDIGPVINWLNEQKQPPNQTEMSLSSPYTKFLWIQKEKLLFKRTVLYLCLEDNLYLVVPACLQKEEFHLCHDSPTAGHMGIKKTLKRLKRSLVWHRMSRNCTCYVKTCAQCNQNKPNS